MDVSNETRQGVTVVTLDGDIDGKNAGTTQANVLPLIPQDGKLLLDMTKVGYMSSAGLRMLLLLYRQALGKGSSVALVGLSEEIRDTMSATGFLDHFKVASSVDEGVAALSS
ncbi:anti-sigma factor antagonist [Deinococcus yavapaiensis]|uniref:Anti-sigma factor antagonist n=1 Tax=Deinococcus yavapaiensis KR-236 TaxID=694435 RepID=A0A318SPN9_9DEIO|nr:anti-sigma factor antagonist [Deinococcus yavapaiensis]PYE54793.1 anti-sigma B factor antagonist [Deinococcus yavapaiensis KR-236]